MNLLVTIGAVLFGTAIWLWILRRYDRVEPEAIRYLVQVALVGGAVSVFAAALLNEGAQRALGIEADVFNETEAVGLWTLLLFCLSVGFIEEIVKAIACVFTTRRLGDLDEPIDAMIYAMTVGLGFAAIENAIYASRFGNDVLLVRFLWPVPAHMAYSALWGYGLAKAVFVHPELSRTRVMAKSVVLAALVHAAANFLLFMQNTVAAMLSLMALGAIAYLAHMRLRQLVYVSPFLAPGECPVCRTVNLPRAVICVNCGEPFLHTELFEE